MDILQKRVLNLALIRPTDLLIKANRVDRLPQHHLTMAMHAFQRIAAKIVAILLPKGDHGAVGHRLPAHLLGEGGDVLAEGVARRVEFDVVDEVGLGLEGHLGFDGDAGFAR